MKAKALIIIGLCAAIPVAACAGKKKKNAEPVVQEQPAEEVDPDNLEISQECLEYISLFHESVKNKQYADAMEPWTAAYEKYPSSRSAIYSDGVKIIKWKLESLTAGTPEYNEWRDKLMKLYDDRCKYFGRNAKYPTSYILGQKGLDYCKYFEEDELKAAAYPWLKTSVAEQGVNSQITVVDQFFIISLGLYRANPETLTEQLIGDYSLASNVYDLIAADASNKNASKVPGYKDRLNQLFAVSGAATPEKLDELYASVVPANTDNLETLNKIMSLYERIGGTESDVYFAAAKAAHILSPSAASAVGCAAMSKKQEQWNDAINYYNQAVELAETNDDKAEYLFRAASVYANNLNNGPKACEYANKSLSYKADQGRCYILIAVMYAKARPYDDPILNRSVYWAAVDKLYKAKEVDPSCTEDANKLISRFSAAFPTKEEIFFHNSLSIGGSFTVGGWIGSTTRVRSRD